MGISLRAAVVGTGFIGGIHARSALLNGARLVGVAASTPERSRTAARELRAERPFDTAEELVESPDVDVVHICTPNYMHAPLAHAALAAGKHVIVEKPVALDADEARRLNDAALASEFQATVPFVYRYYPTIREARERINNGKTGELRLLHGSYLQDWLLSADDDNWRVDVEAGGASRAFADIGSHWCDLVEFVSGHRIARLSASTTTAHTERRRSVASPAFSKGEGNGEVRRVETEDAAVIQFQTDRGAIGAAVISQVTAGRKNRLWIELDGAEEAIAFDQEQPELLWCGRRESATILRRDPAWMSPDAARLATLPGGHPQGYADCFEGFVAETYEAIRSGTAAAGLPVLADGLRAAEITEAVLKSAATASWVDVPEATPAQVAK